MSTTAPWRAMRAEIDLPARTATWVLTAHVLTILAPLAVIAVVALEWETVAARTEVPWLFYAGASMLVVASVAESAQNTLDRWYLTAVPRTLLDAVFSTLVICYLAATVVAAWGWDWLLPAVVVVLAFLAIYLLGGPIEPVQTVAGVASVVALWRAFDDPVVLLSLLAVFLTVFFLDILLRTHQQAMHGFVTLVNAVGLIAVVLAISDAAHGTAWAWWQVIVLAGLTVGTVLALRRRLLRLPATPRRTSVPVDA
jgi:uncharacterized membrane protein YqgA involved in biofilm formation